MVSPVLLQKDDARLPDFYTIKIKYVTGNSEEFKVASHIYHKENDLLEFWTSENPKVNWVQMRNVERIEFDETFTKIVNMREENERKKAEKK